MAQEFKIISTNSTTTSGITMNFVDYIDTSATTISFSGLSINTVLASSISGNSLILSSSSGFKMGNSATNGYVLTADANGNGTWQVASSGSSATSAQTNDGTSDTLFVSPLGLENSKYNSVYGNKTYMTASGTNSYSGSATPAITALTAGCLLTVKFTNANTNTGCTFTLNSLATKNLIKGTSTSLVDGDILANGIYRILYDGTQWVIMGYVGSLRSIEITRPADVTSGSALAISLVTNDRIQRDLTGANVTANNYIELTIPYDFISFPTNALSIDTRKNSASNDVVVTWGISGGTDSTLSGVSIVATSSRKRLGNKIIDTW